MREKLAICGAGAVVVVVGLLLGSLGLVIVGLAVGGCSLFV